MKKVKLTTKQKVINKLIEGGANTENAIKWTEEHWYFVSTNYKGISKMADVIMSL